jgi:hypothetical protein
LPLSEKTTLFGRDRSHLHNQGTGINLCRTVHQKGPGLCIVLIREKTMDAGIPLHHHFVPVVDQQGHPLRGNGDPVFLKAPLARNADLETYLFVVHLYAGDQRSGRNHGVKGLAMQYRI